MVAKDTDGLSVPSETETRSSTPVQGDQLTTLGGKRVPAAKATPAAPPEMWRSLEEYADVERFREKIEDEFPRYAPSEWDDDSSRRSFLKLAGASMGLAAAACTRQPQERIVPYVEQPENYIPGKPMFFASALPLGGTVTPVIAESHMGRPTKLAGNPEHPFSQGATDVLTQAAVLDLYDPDRSSSVERQGRSLPWETMAAELAPTLSALEALGGEGVRVLSAPSTSPSFLAGLSALRQRFPRAEWVQYEAVVDDSAIAGSRMAFDTDAVAHYDYGRADVVVSLDADFLNSGAAHLRSARDFAAKRNVRGDKREMNRLYVVESTPSGTGTLADHRLPVRPSEVISFAAALAGALGVGGAGSVKAPADEVATKFLEAAVDDLSSHRGSSVVVAGEFAAPEVHALAHAINDALGNVGATVTYTAPVVAEPSLQAAALGRLVGEIEAGQVQMLAILGSNPVYDAPGDVDFASALERVPLSIHLGMHKDETGQVATWHVPQAHALEAWGDGRTVDGTLSITQPLIEPLFNGRAAIELLDVLAGHVGRDSYQLVQDTWREAGLDGVWRKSLHDGFVADSAFQPKPVTLQAAGIADAVAAAGATSESLEIVVRPDPSLYDGRFANNGWLQELSKPITKISWDQTIQLAPAEAKERGLETGDVVALTVAGRSVEAPVWIVPGQARGTAVVHLGYGRDFGGRAADGNGQNAQVLRSSGGGYNLQGELTKTGRQQTVASTQEHYQIEWQSEQAEKRHLVRHGTIDQYKQDSHFVEHIGHHVPVAPMFERWEYNGHAWGMVVDLSSCTGCNACIIACQAENNIPVVGRDQIIAGREMAWLRIDRYFQGDLDSPAIHHQPVACQHCEQAPCEVVCPVGATVHSDEGLNDMVYNRCIGTRYCSNNCPYKVRRFNFFKYQDTKTPVLKLQRNPNVSVRARGVMEKCSYCVQRINAVRQQAKVEGRRPIRDGEVQTACQEICPSQAIAFGDLNDPQSQVAAWKKDGLGYALLDELDTLPRTTYLAKINNPHPSLDSGHDGHGGGHGAAAAHGAEGASTDDDHGAAAADDHAEPAAQH